MQRIALLISGRGSNMAAIAAACRDERWPARLVGVIADREAAPGLALARAAELPAQAIPYRDFADRAAFEAALAARLEALGADLVLLCGFMRVLGDAFVARFAGRMVNIHPSLLPAFPGLHTHRRALESGVRLHGATVHFVTPELDHGPIIAQAAVPVHEEDTEAVLAERVLAAEHRLYPRAARWLAEGRVRIEDGRVRVQGIADRERLLCDGLQEGACAGRGAIGASGREARSS